MDTVIYYISLLFKLPLCILEVIVPHVLMGWWGIKSGTSETKALIFMKVIFLNGGTGRNKNEAHHENSMLLPKALSTQVARWYTSSRWSQIMGSECQNQDSWGQSQYLMSWKHVVKEGLMGKQNDTV